MSNWVRTGMVKERKNKAQFLATEVELSKRLLFSLVAQMVKNLPADRTQVRSLGREDPLEKEMATHSSILAWRIP